ncbi:MAG: TIGR00725 family protein [Ornithinimicrobium sp.]
MEPAVAYVGVVGPGDGATADDLELASEVGRLLAENRRVVVTGGMGGVMEAASRGATEAGGVSLGLLPGSTRALANRHLSVSIPTGMGEMRNALLVRTCDAVISVAGSWGTLSEIAMAQRTAVPMICLAGWDLPAGPQLAATPLEAVQFAVRATRDMHL